MNRWIVYFVYLLLLPLQALNAQEIGKQDDLFKRVISNYESDRMLEFDAYYKKKLFDDDSFWHIQYHAYLMPTAKDSNFRCYFFYRYVYKADSLANYKYYAGNKLYITNTVEKKVTTFNPSKGEKSPITGTYDGIIVELAFLFNKEELGRMFSPEAKRTSFRDTTLNGDGYLVMRTDFPDDGDFTNAYRDVYINKNTALITKVFGNSNYFEQVQIDDIEYSNLKITRQDTTALWHEFSKISKGFKQADFVPQKYDTLALGAAFPSMAVKSYPEYVAQTVPEKKQLTVYDFWFTSCMPCVYSMPFIEKAYQKYKDKVSFYGVNGLPADIENPAKIEAFLKRTPISYPIVLADYKDFEAIKVHSFPTLYIVDENGRLVFKQIGFSQQEGLFESQQENLFEVLDAKLEELLR